MRDAPNSRTQYSAMIHRLQLRLDNAADAKTKVWWERYLRNMIKFRGVGIPRIRNELLEWYSIETLENLSTRRQLDIALLLFAEEYAEDKLAGILFLQYFILPKKGIDWKILTPKFAQLFKKGYISDWNICDWFCVRVLSPLIRENGMPCARAIAQWNTASNLWQARASVVSFVNLVKDEHPKGLTELVLDSCSRLIRREERFAKTAIGWVLRELSRHDKEAVINFIKKHGEFFSNESLANATQKLDGWVIQKPRWP